MVKQPRKQTDTDKLGRLAFGPCKARAYPYGEHYSYDLRTFFQQLRLVLALVLASASAKTRTKTSIKGGGKTNLRTFSFICCLKSNHRFFLYDIFSVKMTLYKK